MIRGNDLQPRSSAMEIPAPVVSTILNPGSNINTHYPGPTGLLLDDDDEERELTQLERQAQHTALLHLGATRENHEYIVAENIDSLLENHRRGESKALEHMAFLTDVNLPEGENSNTAAAHEVMKSAAMNVKSNYDIRERAGFFSKKSRKHSTVDLTGPLVYPKEFSPPNSSQSARYVSTKGGASRKEESIASAREKSHPRSHVHIGQQSFGSRGLPGGLKLTKKETITYFGQEARAEFFERYRWLNSQRQAAGTLAEEPTKVILFPDSYKGRPPTVSSIWEEEGMKTNEVIKAEEAKKRAADQRGAKANSANSNTQDSPTSKEPKRGRAGTLLSPVHKRSDEGLAVIAEPTYREKVERNPNLIVHVEPTVRKGKGGTRASTLNRASVIGATQHAAVDAVVAGANASVSGNRGSTKTRGSVMFNLETLFPEGSGDEAANSASDGEQKDHRPDSAESRVQVTLTRIDPMSRRRKDVSDYVSDFPFASTRVEEDLRVRTKVIIRTQTLLQGDSFEELKLVQKPENVILAEQREHPTESAPSTARADLDGVTYSAQALLNAVYDSAGNVVDPSKAVPAVVASQQAGYHPTAGRSAPSTSHGKTPTKDHSAGHAVHQQISGSAIPGAHAASGEVKALAPSHGVTVAAAGAAGGGLLKHPQHAPLTIITGDGRASTAGSTITSTPTPLLHSPIKHGPHKSPAGKQHAHHQANRSPHRSHPTTPLNKDAPRSPSPVNTPKMRGTKDSVYGPSKYRKNTNHLLPSLSLNNPLAPHGHGQGAHGPGGGKGHGSGNTPIGDAILARLNVAAKSLQDALLESSHAQAHQQGHEVHHPFFSGSDDMGLLGAHGLSRTESDVTTQHSVHFAPMPSTHATFQNQPPSSTQQTSAQQTAQQKKKHEKHEKNNDAAGSDGKAAAGAKKGASGSPGRGAHAKGTPHKSPKTASAASTAAPSTASRATTAATTTNVVHPLNLEPDVVVHYLDREDFLGDKLDRLKHHLKTTPGAAEEKKVDRYNMLARDNAHQSAEAPVNNATKPTASAAAAAKNKVPTLQSVDIEKFSFEKGATKHVLEPYTADFSEHHVHTGQVSAETSPRQDTHLSFDAATKKVKPLELICVDHRDSHNRKIQQKAYGKTGSLFKYLESKRAQIDFHADISSDSEDGADTEVKRVDPATPVSPLHKLYLSEQAEMGGPIPHLHMHGPQGIGLTPLADDDGSVGSNSVGEDSVDSSVGAGARASGGGAGAGGASVGSASSAGGSKRKKRKIKKPRKLDEMAEGEVSPRSKYIDSCIRKRLNPRASLILRKNFTKRLNLQHHGMGDDMAILFAEAIVEVPYIESINIADNNLTDVGLGPIINAVIHMKDLIDLDISYNTIGPVAASSLSTYLAKESCPLQRLVLRRADVDDGECERFVTSLKTNRHLIELDLCENLIGTAENLNTVMPDLVTGGEALADLLRSGGCVLKSLKLGWNMIRLDGAADLCSSLIVNTTLTYLDLSFNSLGSAGGMALGDALQENKVLKTLNVANNSIDAVACLTICAGVLENEALEHVVFDGNPIGEQGAKTLMLLPTMVGSRVRISASSCNIGIRDANCWFDTSVLVRKFTLDLSNPFERAVALLVLFLIAAHQTYVIGVSEYYDPDTKTTTNLGLTEKVLVDYENKRLVKEQHEQIESLKIVQAAASDVESAMALFREIDADGSGQLDEEEFGNLLNCMGLSMTHEEVRECMSEYDVDNGGVIEMSEFSLFIRNQAKEAERKLKELTEFPIMCVGAEKEVKRYVPPRKGTLTLVITDGFTLKDTYRVLSAADRDYINEIARQSGDLLTMTTYGVQNYKLRFHEAMGVAETLLKENNNKVEILAKILPQMASAADARTLVAKMLDNNKTEIQKLRREIGFALKPMLGCMDGHYCLDLSNELDKFCLNKLLELGMTIAYRRAKNSRLGYGAVGDCSQKGNWSSFRNEIFNGKPVTVTTDFASPMPRSGRLEFDFVSEQRVGKDDFILNDVRFTNMLVRVFQVRSDEREYVLKMLNKTRIRCDKTLNGDAKTVYECPRDRAAAIGEAMAVFYDNLPKRQEQIDRYRQKEGIKVIMEHDPATTVLTFRNVHQYLTIRSLIPEEPKVTVAVEPTAVIPVEPVVVPTIAPAASTSAPSTGRFASRRNTNNNAVLEMQQQQNHSDSDTDDEGDTAPTTRPSTEQTASCPPSRVRTPQSVKMLDSWAEVEALGGPAAHLIEPGSGLPSAANSRPGTTFNEAVGEVATAMDVVNTLATGIRLDEYMRRYVCVMASSNIQPQAKAARTVELLVNAFEYHFIYARHLELLCMIFEEYGTLPCSEYFGTYRVELVISLFACVVDIHNFEIVMRRLTPFEAACVICRLGWLHIYNPMKPEGAYQLELSRREERLIVKTLAQLATAEPGDNLPFVQFRWERDMAPMPGYELTEPWLTEEGLPKKGIWDVVYYAGGGKGKNGCKPMPKLRRSLLQLVFIEEADLMTEADKEAGKPPILLGESFMMANLSIFYGYLAYNEAEFKALKSKGGGAKDKDKKKK